MSTPKTFLPVKSSTLTTPRASSSIPSGEPLWRGNNTNAKSWDGAPQKVVGTSPEVAETWNHTKEVSRPSLVHLCASLISPFLSLARLYCNKICSQCFFGCCPWSTWIRSSRSGSHSRSLACSKVVSWNMGCSTISQCKLLSGMPYRIDHQMCFSKTLWRVYNWLDGVPKLSFQFVRKSMLQEVLSPSNCRHLWTNYRSWYLPFISYLKFYNLSTEPLRMSSDSLSKRHIDPSSNATWNEMISCVKSAPAMQKYNWHWTCSMYVSPSGLSSLIYFCCHLQSSVSIRILKQTQESERNRHIENEALLAAYRSWWGKFAVVAFTVLVVFVLGCLFISYFSLTPLFFLA